MPSITTASMQSAKATPTTAYILCVYHDGKPTWIGDRNMPSITTASMQRRTSCAYITDLKSSSTTLVSRGELVCLSLCVSSPAA
jgi:hypothetical protein